MIFKARFMFITWVIAWTRAHSSGVRSRPPSNGSGFVIASNESRSAFNVLYGTPESSSGTFDRNSGDTGCVLPSKHFHFTTAIVVASRQLENGCASSVRGEHNGERAGCNGLRAGERTHVHTLVAAG